MNNGIIEFVTRINTLERGLSRLQAVVDKIHTRAPLPGEVPALIGGGIAGRLAVWVSENELAGSTLVKNGTGVLTLASDGDVTLTAPTTGTVLLRTNNLSGGRILFSGDANTADADYRLVYTDGKLGIGTEPLYYTLNVNGPVHFYTNLLNQNITGLSVDALTRTDTNATNYTTGLHVMATKTVAEGADDDGELFGIITRTLVPGTYNNHAGHLNCVRGIASVFGMDGNNNTGTVGFMAGIHISPHAQSGQASFCASIFVESLNGDSLNIGYGYDLYLSNLSFMNYIAGAVGIGQSEPMAKLHVNNNSATSVAQIIRGATYQAANLTEWQNSTGTVMARVEKDGVIMAAGYKSSDGSAGATLTFYDRDGRLVTVKNGLVVNVA